MLISFTAANYKSIREPVVLRLAAGTDAALRTNTISHRGKSLLRALLLYGPAGGGKSACLDALRTLRDAVLRSANASFSWQEDRYRSAGSAGEPVRFEVLFTLSDLTYRYGYELEQGTVTGEWLIESKDERHTPLLLRKSGSTHIDRKSLGAQEEELAVPAHRLLLSAYAPVSPKAGRVRQWFEQLLVLTSPDGWNLAAMPLLADPVLQDRVARLLSLTDPSVSGIDWTKAGTRPDQLIKYGFEQIRIAYAGGLSLPLAEAPSGTKALFLAGALLLHGAARNRIMVIDDLDRDLHPIVCGALLRLVQEAEGRHPQLVFTARNSFLLHEQLLRKDQICLVSKESGSTRLDTLSSYRTGEENLEKHYLAGKYGARPSIGPVHQLLKEEEHG